MSQKPYILPKIQAKSRQQQEYIKSIIENDITIACGVCGSGKTLIPLYFALSQLFSNKIQKIVIVRPLVQGCFAESRSLGALPGTLLEKAAPYAGGVMDNLEFLLPQKIINELIQSKKIEFVPLSLLRGRSIMNSFILGTEMQNVVNKGYGLLSFLTRIGEGSKMVAEGDLDQTDILENSSALSEATERLSNTKGVGIVRLDEKISIFRHQLIPKILRAYGL